jgi:predicted nucleic acid-binding protein
MMVYYLDTSALIKRYVTEAGSHWLVGLVNATYNPLLFTSRLTMVEARSVLARRKREASITAQDHTDALAAFAEDCLTHYRFIEFDLAIVDLAGELLERHPLRAYDAVQLASALRIGRVLETADLMLPIFLSADDRLLTAAQAEGLPVDNPNQHT